MNDAVKDDPIVARRTGLLEAEVDGELVGLHVDNGTCYGFNATATRLWALIETPQRLSALRDTLVAEYDVTAEACEADVRAVLAELAADGLVEIKTAD
jgi:hypothetical protein